MNHTRKKIIFILSTMLIGQMATIQDMHGMYRFDIDEEYSTNEENATNENSLLNSINFGKDYIKNSAFNFWNNISNRPIQRLTKNTINLASYTKPISVPVIATYTTYAILPPIISYPLLAYGWSKKIQSLIQAPNNIEQPISPSFASRIFTQIGEGAQEAGINAETIQAMTTTIKTLVDPIETTKKGYELSKSALKTIKDDVGTELSNTAKNLLNIPDDQPINVDTVSDKLMDKAINRFKDEVNEAKDAIKTEINNDVRIVFDIPNDQPVNFDAVSDKLTEKFKDGINHNFRTVLNIPDNQDVNFDTVIDKLTDKFKDELEHDIRIALNIPNHRRVNFDTITDKLTDKFRDDIEYTVRRALNIPNNQAVNFDTVTDKLTTKFKNEVEHDVRRALNIPNDQAVNFDTITDKLTDKFKDEVEHDIRIVLNIPNDQPVNIETITKKTIEEPVRQIFNIDPDQPVTADAVFSNVAKNTIYRFGIPTAALVAATPIAITAGYFSCKYAYHRLTTEPEPPIFIESSEKSMWERTKDTVLHRTDKIPELAYSPELEKTFDLLTRSTINAFHEIQDGKTNIFYEPILMYGPPGTGKTAKAKQMIKQIYKETNGQMQWRITNGSMLIKAGQQGINKMIDWLKKQKAACLFVDEADTLFPPRDEIEKYPDRLEVINHLLSLIGERSNKYIIIMTTNRLGAFDDAMQRRIDNLIHVTLPNEQGRDRVLKLYRDNMLLNQERNWLMKTTQKYCPQLFETNKITNK